MITLGTGIGVGGLHRRRPGAQHRARPPRDRRQGRRALGLWLRAGTARSLAHKAYAKRLNRYLMHLDAPPVARPHHPRWRREQAGREATCRTSTVRAEVAAGAAAEQRGHRGRGAARLVTRHDVVVLGGGPAALAAAAACARSGCRSPGWTLPGPTAEPRAGCGRTPTACGSTSSTGSTSRRPWRTGGTRSRWWPVVRTASAAVRRVRQRRADDHAGGAGGGRRHRRGPRRGRQPRPLAVHGSAARRSLPRRRRAGRRHRRLARPRPPGRARAPGPAAGVRGRGPVPVDCPTSRALRADGLVRHAPAGEGGPRSRPSSTPSTSATAGGCWRRRRSPPSHRCR